MGSTGLTAAQPVATPAAFTPSPAILFSALLGLPKGAPAPSAPAAAPTLAPTALAAAQPASPPTPAAGPLDGLFTVLLSSGGGSVLRMAGAAVEDVKGDARPGERIPEAAPPEEAGFELREAAAPPAEAGSEPREATPPPAGAESKPSGAAPPASNAPAQSTPREERGDQEIEARSEAYTGAVSGDGPLWDRWPAAVMAVAAATETGAARPAPEPTWEI
jgi:hypothetical protein